MVAENYHSRQDEQAKVERAILEMVLELHPDNPTPAELMTDPHARSTTRRPSTRSVICRALVCGAATEAS